MTVKILEIRDRATRIDVMAIEMASTDPVQRYYLWSSGYPEPDDHRPSIGLVCLSDWRAANDLYEWAKLGFGARTMQCAHDYISRHFSDLSDGDVVDIEYILGESYTPKKSERFTRFEKLD